MSVKASGTAIRASQASAASSHPDCARAAAAASATAATTSAASGYGPIRAWQAGQRPVTGSSDRHRQRPGRISLEQAGHSRRGGSPVPVDQAKTVARMRGPASRPTTAPAITQGSVTRSSSLWRGQLSGGVAVMTAAVRQDGHSGRGITRLPSSPLCIRNPRSGARRHRGEALTRNAPALDRFFSREG